MPLLAQADGKAAKDEVSQKTCLDKIIIAAFGIKSTVKNQAEV